MKTSVSDISFGKRKIGHNNPVFIIAEIGINHEGSFDVCKEMVRQASIAGADAIKLQTINADENYVSESVSYELFKKSELSQKQTSDIFEYSKSLGVIPFTTAGDFKTIDWLEELRPDGYKISSGLLTHLPIVAYIAKRKKSILMSSGMASLTELDEAVEVARRNGCENIGLFQCTSVYPAPIETLNLKAISILEDRFGLPIGFSDHSQGTFAAAVSIAAGAVMVEKHFTLDKTRKSFDHALSLEPAEFKVMVEKIRDVEIAMGKGTKDLSSELEKNRAKFYRCLVARQDIQKGDLFNSSNLGVKRPHPDRRGLEPKYYESTMGKRATKNIKRDDSINSEMISD